MHSSPIPGIPPQEITCVILSGGQGLRMGGVDKGLEPFMGSPLVVHALQRVRSQVGAVLINANRNLPQYRLLCHEVCSDSQEHFEGPLAGFRVGLEKAQTPYLLSVPSDCPRFPLDLAKRLGQGLLDQHAQIALARAPHQGALVTHPVFALMQVQVLPSLLDFMAQGGRKIEAWARTLNTVFVDFDLPQDDALAFSNVNTPAQLLALQALLLKSVSAKPSHPPRPSVHQA